MSKFFKIISKKSALPPGTLVHIGDRKTDKISIHIIDYDKDNIKECNIDKIEDSFLFKNSNSTTWININGVHEVDIIDKIGKNYEIHPLTLEDIMHTGQRPKFEDHDNYVFIVLKMLYFNKNEKEVLSEQVSFLLGQNFVISFQEKEGDVFDTVRERIRNNKGRIKKMKSDYLLYSLMDAIVDNYFSILEKFGEKIEILEEQVISNPKIQTMQKIHELKREMIFLRKCVWPIRELINNIFREENSLIKESLNIYFKDLYDHTIQIIDTIESFRDILGGLTDIYLSTVSNKMNEIMKILTIFAAIFIPLTFIAGIYGMNFEYMPELKWKYSYFVALGLMGLTGFSLIAYFKKKGWF